MGSWEVADTDLLMHLRCWELVLQFMVLKEFDKVFKVQRCVSELFSNTMGSLFQSLYNKYSRRNAYSDIYSKVFSRWVLDFAAKLLSMT